MCVAVLCHMKLRAFIATTCWLLRNMEVVVNDSATAWLRALRALIVALAIDLARKCVALLPN